MSSSPYIHNVNELRPHTVIEPAPAWLLINVRELWQFRELLGFLVWRDVKVRYKQTVLGAAWAVLQPALMMVVFTIFFARLANVSTGNVPYPVFVYAGLLPWLLFSNSVSSASQSVVNSERLITKVYFPRLAIPLASVGAAIVDCCVALGLLLILMGWYGITPTLNVLLVPIVVACLLLAATGVGTGLAALNVKYRDVRYVAPFLLQMWMFATPSIYLSLDAGGSRFAPWLALNPLAPLVTTFRAAILGGAVPWAGLLWAALASNLLFVAGCMYFRHFEDRFSDII